jgi:uncharacterized protein
MNKHPFLLVFLSFLFITSCFTDPVTGQINLTGTGIVTAQPDRASFDITFSEIGDTTSQARESMNLKANQALSLLLEKNVSHENIRTTGINYSPRTEWHEGERILLGQEAEQTFHISLNLGDKAEHLNNIIDELTEIDGLLMGDLTFQVSQSSSYREEARRLAFEDARSRAEHYAQLSGQTLGPVISLQEQGNSSGRDNLMQLKTLSENGGSNIQTGVNEITVVIQVLFTLK